MNVYSFRAECEHDVEVWQSLLPALSKQGGEVTIIPFDSKRVGTSLPDVKVEVKTDASYETLMHAMRCVPDGHVMVETFRPCPLAQNSLERRYPK